MTARTRTNRIVLALIGLTLMGGGLLVLAGGSDLYRRLHLSPPGGWPLQTHHDVLFSRADETRWAAQSWWWPTAIAASAALMLLAVAWLIAQHRSRHRPLRVGRAAPPTEVRLRGDVLGGALGEDLASLPGVEHARARLAPPAAHPESRIALTLAPDAAPREVLNEVDGPVERARRSLGWDEFPTGVRLTVTRHGRRRAE